MEMFLYEWRKQTTGATKASLKDSISSIIHTKRQLRIHERIRAISEIPLQLRTQYRHEAPVVAQTNCGRRIQIKSPPQRPLPVYITSL